MLQTGISSCMLYLHLTEDMEEIYRDIYRDVWCIR